MRIHLPAYRRNRPDLLWPGPDLYGTQHICRAIDNLMVTPSGLPVIVECKLWRNPEGRREVVGQILDYAKELRRWSSSDLQREVSRCLKREGNPLLDLVRATNPEVDEIQFNDALTASLRHGRFLLLIVGDGIREGSRPLPNTYRGMRGCISRSGWSNCRSIPCRTGTVWLRPVSWREPPLSPGTS